MLKDESTENNILVCKKNVGVAMVDNRKESFEMFNRCKRKLVVTTKPMMIVDSFVRDFLNEDKVLGTVIEVNPTTKNAMRFVKKPEVIIRKLKHLKILKEFGEASLDIGIGDCLSNHDFMFIWKESYMAHPNKSAKPIPQGHLDLTPLNTNYGFKVRQLIRVNGVKTHGGSGGS